MKIKPAPKRAFSVIELVSVLAIILIVATLILPVVGTSRESARMIACGNNLRQIGLALHTYQNTHERFPIGYVAAKNVDPLRTAPGWSWQSMMLPQLEQRVMWECIDFRRDTANAVNRTVVVSKITIFTCPLDRQRDPFLRRTEDGTRIGSFATTSFAGNYGSGGDIAREPGKGNGFFVRNRSFALDDFVDGLSNTIALGERAAMHTETAWVGAIEGAVPFVKSGAPSRNREIARGGEQVLAHVGDRPLSRPDSGPDEFFSPHPLGSHFLMGDGALRSVRPTISLATLRALASRGGDELFGGSKH
jgi:type II secretory pathway pseudopilin PulG